MEFDMIHACLTKTVWLEIDIEPFWSPGSKQAGRISKSEETRSELLQDWLRSRGGRKRGEEGGSRDVSPTGEPNYSGSWEKEKDDPNG